MRRALLAVAIVGLAAGSSYCGDDNTNGTGGGDGGGSGVTDGSGSGGGGDGGSSGGTDGSGSKTDTWKSTNQPACNGTVYKCSDGKDNDGDGKIDAADPECVGPCDNDEGSFATGIPGDNKDPCRQDCFFDGNSGSGDDKCEWNLKCDPKSPGKDAKCPYDPKYKNCPTSQKSECIKKCRKLAPNGCDCFGCCEVYLNGVKHLVYLGSGTGCTASAPQNCKQCTQVKDCLNPCGDCELCLGKTINDLPAKCFPATPDGGVTAGDGGSSSSGDGSTTAGDGGIIKLPTCSDGKKPCLDNSYCPSGYYCITGCCTKGIL